MSFFNWRKITGWYLKNCQNKPLFVFLKKAEFFNHRASQDKSSWAGLFGRHSEPSWVELFSQKAQPKAKPSWAEPNFGSDTSLLSLVCWQIMELIHVEEWLSKRVLSNTKVSIFFELFRIQTPHGLYLDFHWFLQGAYSKNKKSTNSQPAEGFVWRRNLYIANNLGLSPPETWSSYTMKVIWQSIWGSFHQNYRDLTFSTNKVNMAISLG